LFAVPLAPAGRVMPRVRHTVSFPCTVASYTTQFAAAGVPAVIIIPMRYNAAVDDVFVTTMLEITADVVLDALVVVYRVAYVPVLAVP
jgi:hypothetical protein